MRTLFVAGVALGLFALACAPTPPKKPLIVGDDNGAGPPSSSKGDDSDLKGADETPNADESDTPATDNGHAGASTDAGATDPDACKLWWCTPTDNQADKTAPCNSSAENNTSAAQIKYSESNGMIRVSSISVLVTNKSHRNKNNANVYLKNKGSSTYTSMIQSGDTVPDGVTKSLTMPQNFSFAPGGSIRIDTIFDDSFGDPTGSCEVVF